MQQLLRLQTASGFGLRFYDLGVAIVARHQGLWFGGALGRWVPLPSPWLVRIRARCRWRKNYVSECRLSIYVVQLRHQGLWFGGAVGRWVPLPPPWLVSLEFAQSSFCNTELSLQGVLLHGCMAAV